MKSIVIIIIAVVCSFSLILPNAYAEDFTIDSRCEAGNLILTIVNEEGVVIQNVKVRTTDGLRYTSKIHDTFYSNESGEVSIDFSKNTGYVYVVKGGFNDQRFENENCDPDKIPVWIKTNAQ